MCGIFGLVAPDDSLIDSATIKKITDNLFLLSESRGSEASGIALATQQDIYASKAAVAAHKFIHSEKYNGLLRQAVNQTQSLIGHSRLVTDGSHDSYRNNQPVIGSNIVGVHNGIIVNHNNLWSRYPQIKRTSELDSEIIFSLIELFYRQGEALNMAVARTFGLIQGMASVAALFSNPDYLLLATNNGSIYMGVADSGAGVVFASERYIIQELLKKPFLRGLFLPSAIVHLPGGEACLINISDASISRFSLASPEALTGPALKPRQIKEERIRPNTASDGIFAKCNRISDFSKRFPYYGYEQDELRRCQRCVLPETMPFIEFDDQGVCNFCHNYKKIEMFDLARLQEEIEPVRSKNNEPDCIVCVSGGRDSCYTLHYVKTVLKMNPIVFTYDWGMITDLARRNISRLCGKLGVEHIVVSADIKKKRDNIRRNVSAWLKRPNLGMVPLFMAGDKQFFYYAQKIKNQTGLDLLFMGENLLEKTDFKTGFAGIKPYYDKDHVYTLSFLGYLKLALFYGKEYLLNPAYLNISLFDAAWAFSCYYLHPRDHTNLYKYVRWDEQEIISTLRREYDWEVSADTISTWRIGDGTASFYNYIYLTLAGFTENDTFRSNQIREGMITRDQALAFIREDNKPRFESMQWYLDTIKLDRDLAEVLEIINRAPKWQVIK